ncbi:MAG TPA: DUF2087 domain-containing protein [Rhodoglobus sp.]|nr:DUF2087 domain-containing protein [Rhodoglobus sp.]
MSQQWRRVAAALANEHRRAVYAETVLGLPGEPSRTRSKALRALTDAGLLDADGAPTDVFARLLAEQPAERPQGVDRWLREGRIEQWPSREDDRAELLAWVAAQLPSGELGERAVTDELAALTGDPVALRRYLVDAGLLTRTTDGSRYSAV